MKSVKIKKIVLKDSRLRSIRGNLRTILKLAVQDKIDSLYKIKKLYMNKKSLTPSQIKRSRELSKLRNDLNKSFSRSICDVRTLTVQVFVPPKEIILHLINLPI